MDRINIDDKFNEFMREAYPTVKESSVQFRESRKVFYAGGVLMFDTFARMAEENLSEQEQLKRLQDILKQFKLFIERCEKERDENTNKEGTRYSIN